MKRLQGFTLIELLIVVAIIGILAAIAVPNFLNAQVRAKVARAEADMRSIQTALESFFIDNNSYPPMDSDRIRARRQYRGCDEHPCCPTINVAHIMIGTSGDRRLYLTTPVAYMSSLPYDPFREECGYGYGSNGQSYYILTSWGPDSQDGISGSNGELDEREYTGSRWSDRHMVATRDNNYSIPQLLYAPSNGITSSGEIIRIGP